MAATVEEIISLYLDTLQAGTAEPVEQFLARFPDLSPATAAGLERVLAVAARPTRQRGTAPLRASWQRLAARMESEPLPSIPLPNADHIYVQPARPTESQMPRQPGKFWERVAQAAAVVLIVLALGWLLTWQQAGVGPNLAATPTASLPPPATPTPGSDTYGYRFSAVPAQVDSNAAVISFNIAPPLDKAQYRIPLSWSALNIGLSTEDGTLLPALDNAQGWALDPLGNYSQSPYEMRMTFDTSGVQLTGAEVSLRLTLDLSGGTSLAGGGAPGQPPPEPTAPGAPVIHTQVRFDQLLRSPFDARRRIAEPGTRSEAGGVTVTLDRVVVTASETRFYSRVSSTGDIRAFPWSPDLTIYGDGWTMPPSQSANGSRDVDTGGYEYRITTNLLDKPSPWTLTLPPLSPRGPQGLPQNPPAPLVGPWVFLFAMPAISSSATPGAAAPLPPGLSPTPKFPWGVPTLDDPRLRIPPPTPEPTPPGAQPALIPQIR